MGGIMSKRKKRLGPKMCHYCNYNGKSVIDVKRHEERYHGYFRDALYHKLLRTTTDFTERTLFPKENERIVKGFMISLDNNKIPVTYEWNGKEYDIYAHIMNHKFMVMYDNEVHKFKIKDWDNEHKKLIQELKDGANGFNPNQTK